MDLNHRSAGLLLKNNYVYCDQSFVQDLHTYWTCGGRKICIDRPARRSTLGLWNGWSGSTPARIWWAGNNRRRLWWSTGTRWTTVQWNQPGTSITMINLSLCQHSNFWRNTSAYIMFDVCADSCHLEYIGLEKRYE